MYDDDDDDDDMEKTDEGHSMRRPRFKPEVWPRGVGPG